MVVGDDDIRRGIDLRRSHVGDCSATEGRVSTPFQRFEQHGAVPQMLAEVEQMLGHPRVEDGHEPAAVIWSWHVAMRKVATITGHTATLRHGPS